MIFMKNICFKRYIYENDKFKNIDKKSCLLLVNI